MARFGDGSDRRLRAHGRIRRLRRRARGDKHEDHRNGGDDRLSRRRRREKKFGWPGAHGRGEYRYIRAVGPALAAHRRSSSQRSVLLEDRHWAARALQLRDRDQFWRRRHPSACGCPVAAQPVTWLRRSSDDPDSGIVMDRARLSVDGRLRSVGSSECRTLEGRLALLAGTDAAGRLVDVGEREARPGKGAT